MMSPLVETIEQGLMELSSISRPRSTECFEAKGFPRNRGISWENIVSGIDFGIEQIARQGSPHADREIVELRTHNLSALDGLTSDEGHGGETCRGVCKRCSRDSSSVFSFFVIP